LRVTFELSDHRLYFEVTLKDEENAFSPSFLFAARLKPRACAAPFEHSRCGIEPDPLACHARNMERDSSPVLRGPAGESRAVGQDHITLALSHFPAGRGGMVADERLGIGLRQPAVLLAALETTQHQTS
jgi:hypothetical protein